MQRQMSLEDYKKKCRECLITLRNRTTKDADSLMKAYENEFQDVYENSSMNPETMSMMMELGY